MQLTLLGQVANTLILPDPIELIDGAEAGAEMRRHDRAALMTQRSVQRGRKSIDSEQHTPKVVPRFLRLPQRSNPEAPRTKVLSIN